MARRERGLFRMIFKDFITSLTPNFARRKLVGEDYFGTKYYEIPPRPGSSKKPARSFEPINKQDFSQEVPAEWEAWLRCRRREPPTKEELERNYQIILMKKKNAAELEQLYAAKKEENPKLVSETTLSPAEPQNPKSSDTIAETPGGFKIFEEYQDFGMNYKPKVKK